MIIFDLDGTLWDATYTTLKAANNVADRHSDIKIFDISTIKNGMGLNREECSEEYMPYLERNKRIKYLQEIIKENMQIINKKGTRIYDGVDYTVKRLSKSYKLGIVSNSTDDYINTFLNCSKLKEYFTDYIGAASYNITKAEAIKRMCVNNNEPNSIYVGDIKKDMESAEAAGAIFIHAKYGFQPDIETKYYINDIKELEKCILRINEELLL